MRRLADSGGYLAQEAVDFAAQVDGGLLDRLDGGKQHLRRRTGLGDGARHLAQHPSDLAGFLRRARHVVGDLARRRVLLVDFDPQGALSVGLGIQPHELDVTVYNLLMERGATPAEIVMKTNVAGMDLMPSNIDLSGAEVQLVHEVGREFVLGRVLEPMFGEYDVVLIDC